MLSVMLIPINAQFEPVSYKRASKQQGFAVLTTSVLLSLAAIVFTTHMVSSQLVDNQIVGNSYRNNEAFSNAESALNLVLNQLDNDIWRQALLDKLPEDSMQQTPHYIYASPPENVEILINKINQNKLNIAVTGTSADKSATRTLHLEIDFFISFATPEAALMANKINVDNADLIDSGCAGITENCEAKGDIAKSSAISNASNEILITERCTGGKDYLGINKVNASAISTVNDRVNIDPQGVYTGDQIKQLEVGEGWASKVPKGAAFFGINAEPAVIDNPQSLFQATFGFALSGVTMGKSNLETIKNNAYQIDGQNCSQALQNVGDQDTVIFINGDCDIQYLYAQQSLSSANNQLTIGSAENPKLIFIQGGTFVNDADSGVVINGMLYLLPAAMINEKQLTYLDSTQLYEGSFDKNSMLTDAAGNFLDLDGNITTEANALSRDQFSVVDIGGVTVNGALLSDYGCTYDSVDTSGLDKSGQGDFAPIDNSSKLDHFSLRFDKSILSSLYSKIGTGHMIASGYRISAGSWRDF